MGRITTTPLNTRCLGTTCCSAPQQTAKAIGSITLEDNESYYQALPKKKKTSAFTWIAVFINRASATKQKACLFVKMSYVEET